VSHFYIRSSLYGPIVIFNAAIPEYLLLIIILSSTPALFNSVENELKTCFVYAQISPKGIQQGVSVEFPQKRLYELARLAKEALVVLSSYL